MRLRLSVLERNVLMLMLDGHKPHAIRARLGITQNSYDGARRRMLEKHGCTNDMQLGVLAERNGIAFGGADRAAVRVDARRLHGGESLDRFLSRQGSP